jgi:hypothetical protein
VTGNCGAGAASAGCTIGGSLGGAAVVVSIGAFSGAFIASGGAIGALSDIAASCPPHELHPLDGPQLLHPESYTTVSQPQPPQPPL